MQILSFSYVDRDLSLWLWLYHSHLLSICLNGCMLSSGWEEIKIRLDNQKMAEILTRTHQRTHKRTPPELPN